MSTGDTSVTKGDTSKTRCVTPQGKVNAGLTNRVTHVTHFPRELHTRARAHAHAEVTEKRVTMCHVSPDAAAKRYAMCEADEATKPAFIVGNDPPAYKRSVRYAAIDVMILTFGALRRAQWLEKIGLCPPDVTEQIERHVKEITRIIHRVDTPANPAPHVGPRSQPTKRGDNLAPSLFDATRANMVAQGQTNDGCQSGRKDSKVMSN